MTAQEIFDKAAVGLLTQKEKSINGLTCLYRGFNGKKCAAGFCIDDSEYKPEMERNNISSIIGKYKLQNLIGHIDLLICLQGIHDQVSVTDWKAELLYLAKTKGLSTEKIDNL